MRSQKEKRFWEILFAVSLLALVPIASIAQTYQKPELVVQTGHSAGINAIAFSPDGKLLISGGDDKTVKLWDVESKRELRTLIGHNDSITSVAFSPNGEFFASASSLNDGTIKLWGVRTGKNITTIEPDGFVHSIAFYPNGKKLVAIDYDNIIHVWDLKDKKELFTLNNSPSADEVYDNEDFNTNAVTVSADGKFIASTGKDKTIQIWDSVTGQLLRTLRGHTLNINSVTFSGDGKTLASGSNDGTIKIWNVANGQLLKTLRKSSSAPPVFSVSLSPNGKLLAACREKIELWDLTTGREYPKFQTNDTYPTTVIFSPDGNQLAAGEFKEIKIWQVGIIEKEPFSLTGPLATINALAVNTDGSILAWGGFQNQINLWDLKNERELSEIETCSFCNIDTLAFSPDGKFIASGGGYDGDIILWNVTERRELRRFKGHTDRVTALSFSANGKTLVSGSPGDKTVRIWNFDTGQLLKTIRTVGELISLDSIAISPNNKFIAFCLSAIPKIATQEENESEAESEDDSLNDNDDPNSPIKIYDLETGQIEQTIDPSYVINSLAFMPDGRLLTYSKDIFSEEEEIKLWDVKTGEELEPDSQNLHKSRMSGNTAFLRVKNRNFQFIIDEANIKLKNTDIGKVLLNLVAFDKPYSPVLTQKDKTNMENNWLITTPEGFFDGTNEAFKQNFWRFNNDSFDFAPVESFFFEFYHPGLLKDVLRGKSPVAPQNFASLDRRQPQISLNLGQTASLKDAEGDLTSRIQQIQVEIIESPAEPAKNLTSGDVRDVRLFRNGLLVHLWRGKSIEDLEKTGCQVFPATKNTARKVVCSTEVKIVAGSNDFSAYAFNRDNVKSNDAEKSVTGSQLLKRRGTLYILGIGIDKYQSPSNNLNFAVADVESIANGFAAQQIRLNHEQYTETKIIKLTDANATRANILTALQQFASGSKKSLLPATLSPATQTELNKIKSAEPEDALVIYFAGHGTARCDFVNGQINCDRFYLIPHDGFPIQELKNTEQLAKIYSQSISDNDLENTLEQVDAGKILFVIDACDSGQALEAEEKRRGPMNSRGLAQLAYEKGIYILTAAQSRQAALEVSKVGHGLLTFALLEGFRLADKDNNKLISEREWLDFAVGRVPMLQLEAMKQRSAENRGVGNKKAEITFVNDDDETLETEKRQLQTPRVFYRRESSNRPFFVAKP